MTSHKGFCDTMTSRRKWKIVFSIAVTVIIFQGLFSFILRTSDQSAEKVFDQYHDLSSPTISDFLPRTNNDLESLRPSLTMSKEKHNVSLIIGKPTVKRQKGRYLTITLQSLFECITSEHRVIEEILTVVMTA